VPSGLPTPAAGRTAGLGPLSAQGAR